ESAAEHVRPLAALYIGGVGAKKANFYHRIASRMGYEDRANEVQERFLARDYAGAAAAVPLEFLERTCLLGDRGQILAGMHRLSDAGVTTVNLNPVARPTTRQRETLATVLAIARDAGLAS